MEAEIAALRQRIAAMEAELAKAKKHSGNSSKPQSGDIVKPKAKQKKPGRPRKRKIGGQPGHERHTRKPLEPDELDQEWTWYFEACPCCAGQLIDALEPSRVLQQIELPEIPVRKEQHTS